MGLNSRESFLFGLENSNHDFSKPSSLGKNIFTNAFPLALAQYLAIERGLPIPYIKAELTEGSKIGTVQHPTPWKSIIGVNPSEAHFLFEKVFDGYRSYTRNTPNQSDVVVSNKNGEHSRPFEVKLVVIPNSATASKPHDLQSCEIVVRPPSIEQLAFSIANSYGSARRNELLDIISEALVNPMDYKWNDQSFMKDHRSNIVSACDSIISNAIDLQTPFAITAVWRTKGQMPILEQNAFDIFVWSDMAFVQLFLDAARDKKNADIIRPERSLIWLISSLFDYAAQKTLDFNKHHSRITFNAQTDKAGAFAGDIPFKHLDSPELKTPRVTRSELENIMTPSALEHLMPERRLDAAIAIQHLLASNR